MRAFLFPGQGSQKVGMGAELAAASEAAREVFGEVDEALSQHLANLMHQGPEEELLKTANGQPAIMANAMATVRVLERDFGISVLEHGGCVAGHSLGEYTALCAIGAFGLADTARLLKLRGSAMQAAVPIGKGAMAALLGADMQKAAELAAAAAQGEVCEVANDNDPSQVVISGHRGAIERASELAREHGIKRAVILPVSAPFHCSLMAPAAEVMAEALAATTPGALALPVYANVTAAPVSDPEEERALLVEQVTGQVRWRESMLQMHADGAQQFIELGAKVLSPMVGRTIKDADSRSLVTMADLEGFAKTIT